MDFQKLFNYMMDNHGVVLIESDMQEICDIVNEIGRKNIGDELPLDKLQQKLDEALAKETSETLMQWLDEKRQ